MASAIRQRSEDEKHCHNISSISKCATSVDEPGVICLANQSGARVPAADGTLTDWKSLRFCECRTMTGNHAKRELACLQAARRPISLLLLGRDRDHHSSKEGWLKPGLKGCSERFHLRIVRERYGRASTDSGADLPLHHLISGGLGIIGTSYEIENDAIVPAQQNVDTEERLARLREFVGKLPPSRTRSAAQTDRVCMYDMD